MLNSEIFRICYQCFIPDVDLFAPRQNKQLHMNRFVSLNYDPEAYQVNAISVFWSKFCLYIFPTFKLIGIVIKKIVDDCVKLYIAFIKIPLWKTHAWFLLVRSAPVLFQSGYHKNLLTMPHTGEVHPLQKIRLVACIVSGDHSKILAFQSWLQK